MRTGGREGQKWLKWCVRTIWMPPYQSLGMMICRLLNYSILKYENRNVQMFTGISQKVHQWFLPVYTTYQYSFITTLNTEPFNSISIFIYYHTEYWTFQQHINIHLLPHWILNLSTAYQYSFITTLNTEPFNNISIFIYYHTEYWTFQQHINIHLLPHWILNLSTAYQYSFITTLNTKPFNSISIFIYYHTEY